MKIFFTNPPTPSTLVWHRLITGCLIFLTLCILSQPAKGCDRASLSLDSVVCEGSNYRIYLNLCLGGGITGTSMGAADDTRDIAFGFYTSAPSMSVLGFSPAVVTGDSTGISMQGVTLGAIPNPPFGFQAGVYYIDPGQATGFMCVSSLSQCGNMHTQCDQFSFLVDVLPDSVRLFGAEGNGNPTTGCFPNSDMSVDFTQIPLAVDAGLDTLICRGDTIALGGSLTSPFNSGSTSFLWSPATYLNNAALAAPLAWPQSTTTFVLEATANAGCLSATATGSDSVTVTVDTACVWPGDCNYDLVANYLDILPIGLAYNYSGPIRPVQGSNWAAHAAYDWNGSFVNGPNHKHADADGNGLVDFLDAFPVLLNYGQTHNGNRVHNGNSHGLYFIANPDSAMAGDSISIIIGLGTQSLPADSVYGLGFQLFYPSELVDSGSVVVNYDSSWLGTNGTDMITLDMDLYQSGVVEVGMTRIDHIDQTGYGEICRIGIAMRDDISAKVEELISRIAVLTLTGGVTTAADERRSSLNGETDSIVVWGNGPLPVTWQDFRGRAVPGGVQLDWVTQTEINADRYQVERAFPGGDFSEIGTIAAAGNSSGTQRYEFFDGAPRQGENIYRLLQTDQDGSSSYSRVVSVTYEGMEEISLTTPPYFQDDQLTIALSNPSSQQIRFQLFTIQGQQLTDQLLQLEEGSHTLQFNCETLSTGVYLFHLKTASAQATYKVIHP